MTLYFARGVEDGHHWMVEEADDVLVRRRGGGAGYRLTHANDAGETAGVYARHEFPDHYEALGALAGRQKLPSEVLAGPLRVPDSYAVQMESHKSPTAAEARRDLVLKLGTALIVFGAEAKRLTTEGTLTRAQVQRLLPAGLVSSIGGELEATIAYLGLGRWAYGSAALVRQLVEVEYLSWATTNDPDDAWDWFRSDRETRLQRWQPGKIRQRSDGRFPNTDYHDHCEAGGHPVPQPAMQILDNRDTWVEVTLYEAALHGSAAWHYLLHAVENLPLIPAIQEQHRIVDEAYAAWRAADDLRDAFQRAAE